MSQKYNFIPPMSFVDISVPQILENSLCRKADVDPYASIIIGLHKAIPTMPDVSDFILNLNLGVEHIRSSVKLKDTLEKISAEFQRQSQNKAGSVVRLNVVVDLLVSELCVPHVMTLIGVGFSLKIQRRLEGIMMQTFILLEHMEKTGVVGSPIDEELFRLFVALIDYNTTPLLPHSITVTEHAPFVLKQLSNLILGVSTAPTELSKTINSVVSRLSVILSNKGHSWTLDEKQTEIKNVVIEYIQWLRLHSEDLVHQSLEEAVLHCVDASVRAWLKDENYSSTRELVSVYNQKYRKDLTHISVPLSSAFTPVDVQQAVCDIERSHISVSGVTDTHGLQRRRSNSGCTSSDEASGDDSTSTKTKVPQFATKESVDMAGIIHTELSLLINTLSPPPPIVSAEDLLLSEDTTVKETPSQQWRVDLLNLLYTQTILAASYSYSANSAYHILCDLYGGDGLVFCRSRLQVNGRGGWKSTPGSPRAINDRNMSRSNSGADDKTPETTVGTSTSPVVRDSLTPTVQYADVQVNITTSKIKVILVERYGLYTAHDQNACHSGHKQKALCNFKCTTTTTINLVNRSGKVDPKEDFCYCIYESMLSATKGIYERTVSIQPYLEDVV